MSFFAKAKKIDLIELATELGLSVESDAKVIDLKRIITESSDYDEEFCQNLLGRITEERLAVEAMQKAAAETERIKADREYELEKLRIERFQTLNNTELSNSHVESRNVHSDLRKLMHEYNVKDGDINFYLIIFERQAKRMGIKEEDWVSHLIGLLPYEITQLIARENEDNANDYAYVKSLLLKRYKLSSDKFRVKFLNHVKSSESSWKDFAFELMSYCTEWIAGVGVSDFDGLKNLIVTEQMKKRVNTVTRDHFIDEWSKINNPDQLAEKLDSYDSVRFKNNDKYENAVNYNSRYDKSKVEKKLIPNTDNKDKKRLVGSNIRNEKGEFKCFNCNFYGHIAKDCLQQKSAIYYTKCKKQGHTYRTCKLDTNQKEESNNLSVSQGISNSNATMAPTNYLKDAFIYGNKVSAFVDTGSSSCLLKESIASKLDLDVQPDESELFGFGNQNTPVSKTIGKAVVNIRVDDVVGKSITLLIVKDDTQPCDLILGRTWIDLPYIAFARVGSNLRFGYADNDLLSKIQIDLNDNKIKLKTTEKIELVGNSINLIKASTNEINNGLILVKGIGQNFDSILEVTNGETIVPVVNAEQFKIKIKENQCLGRGMEIKEESIGMSKEIQTSKKQNCKKNINIVDMQESSITIGGQQGLLNPIPPGKRPFSVIHIDHLGPFVKTSRRNEHLLVIIDNFTRFVRIYPVKSTSTQNVLKAMQDFVNDFGLPDRIISDRGSCFTSRQFEEFCTTNGIKHILNSTRHAQANGMVERCNRTILSTISTSMEDHRHKDWDLKVKAAERNLNNAINKTTNKTPFEMLHGYSPRFYDGILSKLADNEAKGWKDPTDVRNEAINKIEESQQKMKAYYDKRRCKTIKYDKGEIVVMRKTPQATGHPLKTQPKYRGPLIVTDVLPSDTYRVTQYRVQQPMSVN